MLHLEADETIALRRSPDILPGRLFVFQHVDPLDIDAFAISELPRRMDAVGMRILHAPKSIDEMPTGEPMGYVWWIDFEMPGYKGRIHPWLDEVLYQRGGLAPNGSVQALVVNDRVSREGNRSCACGVTGN